jgi:hypothetical protein
LKAINASAYLNNLAVDSDGTIYVAGSLTALNAAGFGDSLIKIPAAAAASGNLASATSALVKGGANSTGGYAAMDVALFGGKAYVTEYLDANSTIAVFYTNDLSGAGIITPPNPNGPSGQTASFNTGVDSGFGGIDISADGKIFVAEQVYRSIAATGTYTPPGGSAMTGTQILFDRILVSTTLDTAGPVTSSVVANPNPVTASPSNTITLTATVSDATTDGSTLASAEYSTDGGSTWHAMTASDGTFDQVTENVTASFTLGSAGLSGPGTYTILVRGTDTANQTGGTASVDLEVQNTAPTANAGGPYFTIEGGSLGLDGSASSDPDQPGNTLTYEWDFDGDGVYGEAATAHGSETGPTPTFQVADLDGSPSAQYLVKLRVTDNASFSDVTQATINIANREPTAALANGGAVNEGSSGTVGFSGQSDPSSADNAAGFYYAYDFDNDGTFEVTNSTSASAAVPASFLDDGPGSLTVRGRILDKDGGFNDYTTTITINSVNPTATLSNGGAVNEGSNGSVGFSNPFDPSTADTTAGFLYAFDFDNDGSFELSGVAPSATVPASYLQDGPGSRVVRGRITDKDGGFTDYTTTITINNVKPTAAFSNGGAVNEGSSGPVSFSGQLDPSSIDTAAGFRYAYDFDNDGTFEVGSGTYTGSVTSASATVPASYLDNGPGTRAVRARIIDKDGGYTDYTTSITINNVKPVVAAITGPSTGAPGQTLVFSASFSDPGILDTHTASISWGDTTSSPGSVSESGGSGVASGSHTYLSPGTYTVTLTVTDKDNGSTSVTKQVSVGTAGLQTDPCDASKTALYVGGTSGNDVIKFSAGNSSSSVKVTVNNVVVGTYSPTGHIIAYGLAGNDTIQVASGVNFSAWFFGGTGNDNLQGAGRPSLLVGEDGNDTLSGISGNDVLIGGKGADKITGNGGDDLLIAGFTSYDTNVAALCGIMDEWTSTASYSSRTTHLKGVTGGLNNGYNLIAGSTVFDDSDVDELTGSGGTDWFFANTTGGSAKDKVKDQKTGELLEEL